MKGDNGANNDKKKVNDSGHKLREDGSGLYNTGRPPKPFNKEQFEELCKLQCTQKEICAVMRITERTLNTKLKEAYGETFSQCYEVFSAEGKMSLRRAQFNSAVKNENVSMQKWLGIQLLNQKDKVEEKVVEKVVYKTDASDLTDEELDKELQSLMEEDEDDE